MTIDQAAKILRLSTRRVRALVQSGRIPAMRHGRDWWIEPADFERFSKLSRKSGRPPKMKKDEGIVS